MAANERPRLAVWKFSSCDGCQLTLLDCEDELLQVAGAIDIAYFLEAGAADVAGPYDLSLVEGSVTTPDDVARIKQVREASRHLVTIGACATAGGVQALRNLADVEEYLSIVYAQPQFISTLDTSTPIAAHVPVDFELRGCPIDRGQLLEVLSAFLHRRRPEVPNHSVCVECKMRGNVCVMVAHGTPCLGPVTHAGCGALCPTYNRGCYGCFGPMESPNTAALADQLAVDGVDTVDLVRLLRTFNTWAPAFRDESADRQRRMPVTSVPVSLTRERPEGHRDPGEIVR
jgi:coenzyme F420-reducing hydrogenase gamma subunit